MIRTNRKHTMKTTPSDSVLWSPDMMCAELRQAHQLMAIILAVTLGGLALLVACRGAVAMFGFFTMMIGIGYFWWHSEAIIAALAGQGEASTAQLMRINDMLAAHKDDPGLDGVRAALAGAGHLTRRSAARLVDAVEEYKTAKVREAELARLRELTGPPSAR